ncbi:response regulator [Sphingobacterium sp. ML3W]|uniref:two-component regulator propeller domain-containing protein n=1 Tax=Sphingobacterium sp. ML3W TaxID=1538644 RepID=UPI00249AB698|nr:two-component regulator propeller domain-containing protein [Sphingobacterium sp. ML3W]WFA81344.1 response regulator [Sphingobacterium sp. ML3W]
MKNTMFKLGDDVMKYLKIVFLFGILVNIFLLTDVLAQPRSQVNKRSYTMDQGLSSNRIYSIVQDSIGFIWIGTNDGLNRFDGTRFRSFRYDSKSSNCISSNSVMDLLIAADQKLWIALDNGVDIYDPYSDTFKKFVLKTAKGEAINGRVLTIIQDKSGDIWIGTSTDGLFRYLSKKKKLLRYTHNNLNNNTVLEDRIIALCEDSERNIWIGTYSQGLSRYSKKTNSFTHFKKTASPTSISDNSIQKIFEDSYGYLWIGTFQQGIDRFDKSTSTFLHFPPSGQNTLLYHIQGMREYQPGKLIVSSDNGVGIYDNIEGNLQYSNLNTSDFSFSNNKFVYDIFKDREGGLWLGSYFDGLAYFPPAQNNFKHYELKNSHGLGKVVNSILELDNGQFLVGTDDNGIHTFDSKTGKIVPFRSASDINATYYCIHDLLQEGDKLFTATYERGLEVIDLNTKAVKSYLHDPNDPSSIPSSRIFSLFKSSNGRIYIGTGSGVCYYNREQDNFVRLEPKFLVLAFAEDAENNIWIATNNKGLYKYNVKEKTYKKYEYNPANKSSLIRNTLTSLTSDANGNIWVGSNGYGLCRYDKKSDSFIRFEQLNLPNQIISSIVPDGNMFWVATNKGLVSMDNNGKNIKLYTKSNGLFNEQFTPQAFCLSSTGRLMFGTANGFCQFSPNKLVENKYVPPVVITSLSINNKVVSPQLPGSPISKPIELTSSLNLNYNQSTISVEFASLSYVDPSQTMYKYKLEGFDEEWHEVSRDANSITFTNLPAGKYKLLLKNTNSDHLWSDHSLQLDIKVNPHFLKSKPAIIIYCIVLIALIIFLIRYLLNRSEERHHEQIKKVELDAERQIYDSKLEFFTNIAHEIRTPLSLIIGPIEYISKSKEIKDNYGEYLSIVQLNYRRLYSLITQLLDFRKVDTGNYRLTYSFIDLTQLIDEVRSMFKIAAVQSNIKFETCMASDHLHLYSDKEALIKILSNLISNALKFAHENVTLSAYEENDWTVISIEDDGRGIGHAERENIFKAFYQVSENGSMFNSGIGVGLHLTKSLIEMLGGEIAVLDREEQKQGTNFLVKIPTRREQWDQKLDIAIPLDLQSVEPQEVIRNIEGYYEAHDMTIVNDKKTVLVVDDNIEVLEFLSKILTEEYFVITALNGLRALEILKEQTVDLIVSDIMMEDMDGLKLCRQIKRDIDISHIPIVLLSAKHDIETKLEGLEIGTDAYVEKPFSPFQLKAQLKNLLEKREELKKRYASTPNLEAKVTTHNKMDEEFIERCLAIINENLDDSGFSIEKLASEMAMSRTSLFSKVKAITGMTPNDFIKVTRLKEACKLLKEGKYRVTEIGYLVGFGSPSYFTKCFSKQFGMLPTDYVKM